MACTLASRLTGWGGLVCAGVLLGGGEALDRVVGRGPSRALQRNGGPPDPEPAPGRPGRVPSGPRRRPRPRWAVMIAAVIIAWLTIGLFLLALPLAAWWLGGRSFLDRPNAAAEGDALARAVTREHGLSAAQAALVGRAVRWGRTVEDPAMRPVAVDWAQRLMELDRRRREARPRLRGWLVVLLVVWGSLVVGRVVLAVAQGRWSDVNWFTVALYTAAAVAGWRLWTGPQRAVERNDVPAS